MTIYEIKYRLQGQPYFFTRDSMRFFGQTLKSFSVCKYGKGYRISAPIKDRGRIVQGAETERFFDPVSNTFVKAETLL
jgi:hypothetical protein